jgi:hypothetical protein
MHIKKTFLIKMRTVKQSQLLLIIIKNQSRRTEQMRQTTSPKLTNSTHFSDL